jgi:hypothetical protein
MNMGLVPAQLANFLSRGGSGEVLYKSDEFVQGGPVGQRTQDRAGLLGALPRLGELPGGAQWVARSAE